MSLAVALLDMVGPVLSYAVRRIGDFLIEEAVFLWYVEKEVERLRDELRRMESFLVDTDSKRKENQGVENWVSEVRKVSYDAEDLLESFVLEEEKERRRRKNLKGKCIYYSRLPCQLCRRYNFGRDTRLLWKKIDEIEKSTARYRIERPSAEEVGKKHVDKDVTRRRSVVLHADFRVVGMDDEKKAILDLLLPAKKEDRRFVVSIVGMGGLGKTTLAKKVFKDSKIQSFEIAAWIDVSQQYTDDELFRNLYVDVKTSLRKLKERTKTSEEISKKIGSGQTSEEIESGQTYEEIEGEEREKVGKMRLDAVTKSLHQSLHKKKYLIVMDDVWEEKVWEIFGPHLPDDCNGSRVLITTRHRQVAEAAQPSFPPHQLRFRNEEESWDLFLNKAYPHGNGEKDCRGEFKKLGEEIVKKCGGLPLALVMAGGLLSRKPEIKQWGQIATKISVWRDAKEGRPCMEILALSYADLPPNLKWCFLYLGAFPEDFEIDVPKLIRLWIAEGFVSVIGEMTLEEVAEWYLEDLSLRCLVQVSEHSINLPPYSFLRKKKCRIHDLLRELAIKESEELGFFHRQQRASSSDHSTSLDYSSLRRFSIHAAPEFSSRRHSTSRLRTLMGFQLENVQMDFPAHGMRLIRVIDLEGALIEVLPEQVGELANLRYLGLKKTKIKSLPSSVHKLSRLQTLDVRQTPIKCMSSSVWKIKALRHLLVSKRVDLSGIQPGNLGNLQVLASVGAGDWMNNCLSNLTTLQTLQLEEVDSKHHEELSVALPLLSCLTTLTLRGNSIPAISLTLRSLRNLHWVGIRGRILPPQPKEYQWPQRISTLHLNGTELDKDPFPSLGELTGLRDLYLLWNAYCGGEMTCPPDSFPELRNLYMIYLTESEKWNLGDRAMPRLNTLFIIGCWKLEVPQALKLKSLTSSDFLSPMMGDFLSETNTVIDDPELSWDI